MAPHTVMQKPVIPGWIVNVNRDAGELMAVRIEALTDYQRMYGCRTEVSAANAQELELLCIAEMVHAAMVAKAEKAARGGRAG